MIHCIGDSNSCFFSGTDVVRGKSWWGLKPDDRIPSYKSYNIGPATAYKFGEKHIHRVRTIISDAKIKPDEPILLVFGEIDCRWHIGRQHEKRQMHPWDVVNETMTKYIDAVAQLSKEQQVILWAVPPPSALAEENHDGCIYGNHFFRFNVTRIWNQALRERCDYHGLPCASIFWDLVDEGNNTLEGVHIDKIHLSQKAMPAARNVLYEWENK